MFKSWIIGFAGLILMGIAVVIILGDAVFVWLSIQSGEPNLIPIILDLLLAFLLFASGSFLRYYSNHSVRIAEKESN